MIYNTRYVLLIKIIKEKRTYHINIICAFAGRGHTLILLDNGELYGCGSGNFGQLGRGDNKSNTADSVVIVKVLEHTH